jgi:putative tricarboxylic transport membrane protein
MKINDAVSGVLLLVLAIAILVNIQSFPKIPGQSLGPAAFPGMLAVLLAGCAVALIFRGLRERAGGAWFTPGEWLRSRYHLTNFLLTAGVLLFYIFAAEKIGFIISGTVILGAMFWKLRVRPALILPIAIVVTLVIHTIFYKGLRVPLPWGVLTPLAW